MRIWFFLITSYARLDSVIVIVVIRFARTNHFGCTVFLAVAPELHNARIFGAHKLSIYDGNVKSVAEHHVAAGRFVIREP